MSEEKKGRTYEEIALSPQVLQRGIDLVEPLSRILLRRSKDVKVFHNRTTDSEWEAFEKEHGISIPADYKKLTNTVGTAGLWLNGSCQLTNPTTLAKSIQKLQKEYNNWQLEEAEDGCENVGVWKDQPAFHMEWGLDVQGSAMSYFWVCAKSSDERNGAWPVVQLNLEAPLQHNGDIHCCTVTEALYRDVIDKNGMGEYDNDDDDEEEGNGQEEKEKGESEEIKINKRGVYYFAREGEPPKSKSKPNDDKATLEDSIGKVGSDQDKKDMAMLDNAAELETVDPTEKCEAMEPVTAEKVEEEDED